MPDASPLDRARRRQRWWLIGATVAFVAYVPLLMVRFPLSGPVGGFALVSALNAFWWRDWIAGRMEAPCSSQVLSVPNGTPEEERERSHG